MHFIRSKTSLLTVFLIISVPSLFAQSVNEQSTIENYYKVKWGHADEFIRLWKANHYPLLKKAKEKGDIISIVATKPTLHSGEDTRWDFKVVISFKNLTTAFDPELTAPYKKQLYPNEDKLAKDEQYRFSLLIAHWDVLTDRVNLD